MADITKKPLTRKQREYINELADGPKTTRDLALSLMVDVDTAATMMRKLRKMERVKSSKVVGVHGNIWQHETIPNIDESETFICYRVPYHIVAMDGCTD